MKLTLKLYRCLSLVSICLLTAHPSYAQLPPSPCSNDNPEQPSSTRREITHAEYGLRFQIPVNYQPELRQETVPSREVWSLRNPTDVAFLDCATSNGLIGAGHQVSDVLVTIKPLQDNILSANDILQAARSQPDWEIIESNITTIANQNAVLYTRQSVYNYPYRSRIATFIHPDQNHLVEIIIGNIGTTLNEVDLEVMDLVISSLMIEF